MSQKYFKWVDPTHKIFQGKDWPNKQTKYKSYQSQDIVLSDKIISNKEHMLLVFLVYLAFKR
jgi:hypothetical protein